MNEEELIDRYLSASMTQENKSELKRLFTEDADFSDRFRNYVEDTAIYISLADELKMRKAFESGNVSTAKMKVSKSRIAQNNLKIVDAPQKSSAVKYVAAIAAMLTVCATGVAMFLQSENTIGIASDMNALTINRSAFDFSFSSNNKLMKGDEIVSLKNELVLTLKDGSKLTLDKGATCILSENSGVYKVNQKRGRIDYEIQEQKNGNKFQVLTNGLRTTVIGTKFTAEASGAKEKVRVLEGLVKVDDFENTSHFINPGEFAMLNNEGELEKANAKTGMELSPLVSDFTGNDILSDSLEEKPYLLILQASKWDPSSRAFVHKLKKFYKQYKDSFEVIFVNDQDNFAYDYEMPWPIVKKGNVGKAYSILEIQESSFPLNIRLINQDGGIFGRSVSDNKWLGIDHVLDAIKSNTEP